MTDAMKAAQKAAKRLAKGYKRPAAQARKVSQWAQAMKKVINENGN